MKTFITLGCMLLLSMTAIAQGSILPSNYDGNRIAERLRIKTGAQAPYHAGIKPYLREDIVALATLLDTSANIKLSALDRRDIQYLYDDNNEWLITSGEPTTLTGPRQPLYEKVYTDSTKTFYELKEVQPGDLSHESRYTLSTRPILKTLYKTPANFFEVHKKALHLSLNPLLNVSFGKDTEQSGLVFYNQRGGEFRGSIDDRIFFQTTILENQVRFPEYVNDYERQYKALPGAGLYKDYNSVVIKVQDGYDFLVAKGFIGFNVTPHVGVQLGHGTNFIGNGYRSLLLSDFANNYLYLKINSRIWKFHYQNIFAELSAQTRSGIVGGDRLLAKKYMAAHLLSYEFNRKLSLSFFEGVIFSRGNQFELQYLNPVILYRTVEHSLGSPDNVLIGFDGRWDFAKGFSLYGQVMLDEFNFRELINNPGWWANKYGIQAGVKYINVLGIDHLDLQAEMNIVRPYTYSYKDSVANYSHWGQSLAHPLGSNFKEYIFQLRYQPTYRLVLDGRFINAYKGEDAYDLDYGGNILIPNSQKVSQDGNELLQGVFTQTQFYALDISYQLSHNLFLDLHVLLRDRASESPDYVRKTNYFGGGVRLNMGQARMDF